MSDLNWTSAGTCISLTVYLCSRGYQTKVGVYEKASVPQLFLFKCNGTRSNRIWSIHVNTELSLINIFCSHSPGALSSSKSRTDLLWRWLPGDNTGTPSEEGVGGDSKPYQGSRLATASTSSDNRKGRAQKGVVSVLLTALPSSSPLEKSDRRSVERAPPPLMPRHSGSRTGRQWGGPPSSSTTGAQSHPPSCLLFQSASAHQPPSLVPDTQYWINMPGPGPCGNSGELRLLFPGMHRHQQKFISQTHGYFENQISCSVAIKLGAFQVLLYNRNLFCLQLPFTYKNSIREREAIRVSFPISALARHIFLANFLDSTS